MESLESIKTFLLTKIKETVQDIDKGTDKVNNVAEFLRYHAGLQNGVLLAKNILTEIGFKDVADILSEAMIDVDYNLFDMIERRREGESISIENEWEMIRNYYGNTNKN